MGLVLRFPVEKTMPSEVALERLGPIRNYQYPISLSENVFNWFDLWVKNKEVLIGWGVVNKGIIRAFREGRVKHIVSSVLESSIKNRSRPQVSVLCSSRSYPVWNWDAKTKVASYPSVLLSTEQSNYFCLCSRCQAILDKRGGILE